jgi:thiamine biosynthesis lipoprotein
VLGTLALGGGLAAVTSGGYQRFFEQDGRTYPHILDPKTGCPAESGLTGVTVVCADGARADALSTALFVLGEDGALALWREAGGFELLLVTADGRVVLTPELEKSFTAAKKAAYSMEIAG